jgi:hypothetical protein
LEERRATGARHLGRARRWKIGLARKPQEAKAFYATIVVATLVGTGISFSSIAPIKARALMAKAAGVSLTSVQRIWKAHGLAQNRIRSFKISNDPKFATKVRDIVGLYVDPPAHAVVLSVDEKSQIQLQINLFDQRRVVAVRSRAVNSFANWTTLKDAVTCGFKHLHQRRRYCAVIKPCVELLLLQNDRHAVVRLYHHGCS